MSFFSKQIDKRIAAYQRELIETHYREVENMYRQIRGWRHDYRNHIQMMKVLAANGDMDALKAFDLWIADYRGKRPSRKHGIWQYTSEGTVPGITGDVDLNHAYKNYPAIIQRAGLSSIR